MTADVGLDQMEQQRQRVRRQPPPPRHPKPAADASTGEGVITSEADQPEPRLLTVADDEANRGSGSTAAAAGAEWVPVPPAGELRPTPIRFDARTQQYLREQGADSKLRGLNVTASGIARLAMSRLIRDVQQHLGGVGLRVNVHEQRALAFAGQPGRQRDTGGGFPGASFLTGDRNDHRVS